jgi:RNA polymerase sigma-70 factor (ECF subfamily)
MALLIVLESVTPAERLVFVLHDLFSYPFAEVADIVGRTPAACRQLASSARRRTRTAATAATPEPQQAPLVRAFKQAWEAGDVQGLIELLAADASATGDGGGRVNALPEPIIGGVSIAGFYARHPPGRLTVEECRVNARPGLALHRDGETVMVVAFSVQRERIKTSG